MRYSPPPLGFQEEKEERNGAKITKGRKGMPIATDSLFAPLRLPGATFAFFWEKS
jgi:hypothetical protein